LLLHSGGVIKSIISKGEGGGACDGVDANAEQVRRGVAWVYERYVTDKTLYAVQEEAKAERRGLWHDEKSVAPCEWRHKK